MALATACGDDNTVATTQAAETESTSGAGTSTGMLTTSVDTTESADATGTSTGTTGADSTGSSSSDGTTGEPTLPGQTHSQLVTSGTRASSPGFTVVYTLGQPSQLQSTHTSTNYRVQGGLIGANGSPP